MSLKSVVMGDDREISIKQQIHSVDKALSKNEVPLKHKHARQLILGTHKEKSCAIFWNRISRIQLERNPVISWKFCHLLHKLIQDGHRKVLEESVRYKARIEALGSFWYHLENSDYGRPISAYCKMLVSRLEFHSRNNSIPGNLRLNDNQVKALANADVNQSFELSIEMLDQLDELLALQITVFKKMDNVSWSSLTPQGQCLLAPLILVILDTSKFYDHLVKLIFKLHSKLPPDALIGHRNRFNAIFRQVKEFYEISTNLQYFKFLVSVPKLPSYPPNFLQASELESYQSPNAYLHGDNVSEADTPPDGRSVIDENLVDVNETRPQNYTIDHTDSQEATIEALRRDVEDARYNNERLMNEARARIEQYENRLMQMQHENDHYKQSLEEVKVEVDRLRALSIANERQTVDEVRLHEIEQKAQSNEQNYQKMKSAYTNLRQEHIETLTRLSEAQKELTSCQTEKDSGLETISVLERRIAELELENRMKDEKVQNVNNRACDLQEELGKRENELVELKEAVEELKTSHIQEVTNVRTETDEVKRALSKNQQTNLELKQKVQSVEETVTELRSELEKAELEKNSLVQSLEEVKTEHIEQMNEIQRKSTSELQAFQKSLFASLCITYEQILNQLREDLQNALSITYPNQLVLPVIRSVIETVDKVIEEMDGEQLVELIRDLTFLGHHLADVLMESAAAANFVSFQHFQTVQEQCFNVISDAVSAYSTVGNFDLKLSKDLYIKLKNSLEALEQMCVSLPVGSGDVTAEAVGAELEQEMKRVDAIIQKAVEMIEQMQKKSRATDSGIRLEVNEKILDSCNQLMAAIITLVTRSRAMQEEIVATGHGTANPNEFYKRNHQWTEGLLSAAKAVGVAATVLVQSADGVVSGQGKLEHLIVASQEVAASTTQLFVSSRVKADRESQRLKELSTASRSVNTCTANVVATVKSAQSTLSEQSDLDFSHYTLHDTKKEEMESQVRVLELEDKLMRERAHLAQLRRQHYQLAQIVENENGFAKK